MLHILLVTDSDPLRRRIASLAPEIEWIPSGSGEQAMEVLARSSRIDAIVVARGFFELEESTLESWSETIGDPRRLRLDQGLAIAARIRRELPGNLPIALLDTDSDEIPEALDARAWPADALSADSARLQIARLVGEDE